MAGTPEDQRNAATIYTSLSSYVMMASLGVIAGDVALTTFILDKREHLCWFYVWLVAGLLSSVISIVLGGRGIRDIASAGFDGSWSLRPKSNYFNSQASLCLLGILFLVFCLFCGKPKTGPAEPSADMLQLNVAVTRLQSEVDDLKARLPVPGAKRERCPRAKPGRAVPSK
jgi:hypothetical protein